MRLHSKSSFKEQSSMLIYYIVCICIIQVNLVLRRSYVPIDTAVKKSHTVKGQKYNVRYEIRFHDPNLE